ncbi:MAG: SufD family Fe-S cluster assembly protein [Thermoprotei archaeon]|nr:SufD family Fe-S cluster assembly protein [TACK group archaeon]
MQTSCDAERGRAVELYQSLELPSWRVQRDGRLVYREDLKYVPQGLTLPVDFGDADALGLGVQVKGNANVLPLLQAESGACAWGISDDLPHDKFNALALLGWTHGLMISIPDEASAEISVTRLDRLRGKLVVQVGRHASLKLELRSSTEKTASQLQARELSTFSLQVLTKESSSLDLAYSESGYGYEYLLVDILAGKFSSTSLHTFVRSGAYSRGYFRVKLELGAQLQAMVGDLAPIESFSDAVFQVIHLGRSKSDVEIRGGIMGKGVLRALTVIQQGASGSEANLQERALMIGEAARGIASPSLDVKEKECRAKHGSWIGRIGEDQLFYLRSRGMSQAQATAAILKGLFAPLLSKLSFEAELEATSD